MKNRSLKILLIGFGSIGKKHWNNLLAIGQKEVFVFDEKPGVFDGYSSEVKKIKNLRGGIFREFDIVFICTPASSHIRFALEAARAGASVFIEKPLAVSLKGISVLIEEVKKKKIAAMVACNYRFHPGFKKLEAFIKNKSFGRAILARVAVGFYLPSARKNDFRKIYVSKTKEGGGVVFDSGSHVVDYLSALFGEVKNSKIFRSRLKILEMQTEETAALVLEHKNFVISSVTLDFISRKPVHYLEVLTAEGILRLDFKADTLVFENDKTSRILYKGKNGGKKMFIDELRHFFECVEAKKKPLNDIETAAKTARVLLANGQGL